ncbi:MAG: hypothetical protein K2M27_02120 [Muribaculaceae bacterium]|nr:hypothetical protein [Muribaculaceae bacterium]
MISRLSHIIITLLMAATFAACSHSVDSRLLQADSIIDANPDSALAVIRAIDRTDMNMDDHMFATLLEVKAADKAYIMATSDSTIKNLIRYYIDGNREKELHPVVLYYAGRTYYDLGKIDLALRYFKKAAKTSGQNGDPDLLASIHSQMGGLYFDNHLYRHALRHGKLQLEYCRLLPDSTQAFNARLLVAFEYRRLCINDSAAQLYSHLKQQADTISDRTAASQFYTQFASFLISEGKFMEADSIISSHHISWNKGSLSSILAILNKIDARKGDSTLIENRNRELLNSPNMQPRQQAAKELAQIFIKKGDIDSAFRYTDLYASITDSILDRQATAPLAEVEALISDSENENDLLSKENEIQSRNTIIISASALIILLLTAFWLVTIKLKLRLTNKEIENSKLKEEKNEIKKKYDAEIEILTENLHTANSQKEEDNNTKLIEAKIEINKTAAYLMENCDSMSVNEKNDSFERIERALAVTNPSFIKNVRELNLQKRDFDDTLLIRIGIPQNISAKILALSPSGLGNARRRLLKKTGHEGDFKSWSEFIRSL